MALYNNVPSFSYIHATGISVVWNKTLYMVKDFSTNKKYIYWTNSTPNQLNSSNIMPDRSQFQQLVLINDGGIATIVPPTIDEFSIAFDGNSEKAIKERIYGLYEKNDENGDRFVTIEQDINGIKQIVGSSEEGQDGTLIDRISKVEQKATEIDLEVKEHSKKYNDDKETNQLREDLNSSIIKINSNLGTFKSELTGYFNNNVITDEEATQIALQLEILTNSKVSVDGFVDKVIVIASGNNLSQDVVALQSAKDSVNIAHDNLVNNITNACLDKIITPVEITIIIDSFAKYSQKVTTLKNTCDNIIILGMGGIITEELSNISMKSDELKLSVSRVESAFSNNTSIAKIEIDKQVDDYLYSLDALKNIVVNASSDGVVNEPEKNLINEKISSLNKEKLDIDMIFNSYSTDDFISDSILTLLVSSNATFTSKHDLLVSGVANIISDTFVNDAEKIQLDTLFKDCLNAINNLCIKLKDSIENIEFNKANIELRKAKENLQDQINDVSGSVSNLDKFINTTFENNIIDEMERKDIKQNLEGLNREKIDIDATYSELYSSVFLIGQDKISLKTIYDKYLLNYNELVNIMNSILDKIELINDVDRANLNSALSKLKESLSLVLSQFNKTIDIIATNKVNDAKTNLEENINEVSNGLIELDNTMNGAFKDNLLDEAEKTSIRNSLNVLDKEKKDIDNIYNSVYSNTNLDDSLKVGLKLSYDNYVKKYNQLIDKINELLNKYELIESDILGFDVMYKEHNTLLAAFSTKHEICINAISDKKVDISKNELQGNINDVQLSIGDLETTMNGVFQDGILTESEKLSIKQGLLNLASEKSDIDKQYATVYTNVDLIDPNKSNLKIAYDNYVSSYNALVVVMNNIINKNSLIDNIDRTNLSNAFKDHDVKLGLYSAEVHKAVDAIANKKASDESGKVDKKYSDILLTPDGIVSKVEHTVTELNSLTGEVAKNTQSISLIDQKADEIKISVEGKVDENSIISAINVSKETIKIKSSKIEIEGIVTFSNLIDGTTTISGSNIRTGVIQGIRVEAMSGGSGCVMDDGGLQFYDWLNWWDGTLCGKISFDKYGSGVDSPERLWIRTTNGYAMKLQSSGDMSLEAGYGGQGTGTVWIKKAQIDTLVCNTQQVSNIIAKFG